MQDSNFKEELTSNNFPFVKMQGAGNDFVIVEMSTGLADVDLHKLAEKLCNRNFGIGADGLMIVHPSEIADFRMQIINSDGSEPEMCGNGIRCFAKYVYLSGKTEKTALEIETLAGIIRPQIVEKNGQMQVKVDMGEPILKPELVPVSGFEGDMVLNQPLEVEDTTFNITTVSMGNPHCIIYVDSFENLNFEYWGPKLEAYTQAFPKKINVEFVKVEDENNLHVKVWERGAGPTLACGTGACAVLTSSVLNNKASKKANVHLPGGTLEIEWLENNRIFMTGPAEVSFTGFFNL